MKKVDIIAFIVFMCIAILYPASRLDSVSGRFIFTIALTLYPIYYYLYHIFFSHICTIYIKQYLKMIIKDVEEMVGKDFINKIVVDVIFPFRAYSLNDFNKLVDNIFDYIHDNLEIDEETSDKIIDFFESNKFDDYIEKLVLQRKFNSLNGIHPDNNWEDIFIRWVDFDHKEKKTWKYIYSKANILGWALLIFDICLIIGKIDAKFIFFELLLTISYYFIYNLKKNRMFNEKYLFIVYWPINNMLSTILIVKDVTNVILTNPLVIIFFSIKYLIGIVYGNKVINAMVTNIEESIYHKKNGVFYGFYDFIFYKVIKKMKNYILLLMFIMIIVLNIFNFGFISYCNILTDNIYVYAKNFDILLLCLKNSITNFFTSSQIIDFTYQNDYLISTMQIVLSYFTNVLLIANIVNYLTTSKE